MILDVVQVSKDLFSASFTIERENTQIGNFSLQGRLGSMEAEIQGTIHEQAFKMVYGKMDNLEVDHPFRPYLIYKGSIPDGTVYQTKFNGGLFKKFDYHQMKLNGMIFDLFPISFGNEGSKLPIYNGNKQIAQIEKDCIVYNDLHNYRIFAEDSFASQIAIFFCIYMYINAGYKPGEKVISSKVKVVSTTANKLLKEKYNPEFIKSIEQ